jgi:hypothetical protein
MRVHHTGLSRFLGRLSRILNTFMPAQFFFRNNTQSLFSHITLKSVVFLFVAHFVFSRKAIPETLKAGKE